MPHGYRDRLSVQVVAGQCIRLYRWEVQPFIFQIVKGAALRKSGKSVLLIVPQQHMLYISSCHWSKGYCAITFSHSRFSPPVFSSLFAYYNFVQNLSSRPLNTIFILYVLNHYSALFNELLYKLNRKL